MDRKDRSKGAVPTPPAVVSMVLDAAGYAGPGILGKDVMEDSCGDGAFLSEMARRYCAEYVRAHGTADGLGEDLARHIHGIDVDPSCVEASRRALDRAAGAFGVGPQDWDVVRADALGEALARERACDYVIGNPPYVSARNILQGQRDVLARYGMAGGGADLYVAFFEAGLRMLRRGGVLAYITPSTFMHTSWGRALRCRLRSQREAFRIVDVNAYDAFRDAQTSAMVTCMEKGVQHDEVEISRWSADGVVSTDVRPYGWMFMGDRMTLVADPDRRRRLA